MPGRVRYPQVRHSYILELKYLPPTASEGDAQRQWDEAVGQIRVYGAGTRVAQLCQDTQLHLIILQLRDHELLRLEEI